MNQLKLKRDQAILSFLTKFKISSRNQLASIFFKHNSNPINVCNRVLKRLSIEGSILPVPQSRDKCFLYTSNPSPIHHRSNKIDHQLKIVDFFIANNCPERFLIEPIFGCYEPDIFFKDTRNNSICVEIQLTPISLSKMQKKINQFVKEYNLTHDSKIFVICSDHNYNKLTIPKDFKLIKQKLPKEPLL